VEPCTSAAFLASIETFPKIRISFWMPE